MRKNKQTKKKQAPLKPVQGHYGLEYALAHMYEDLTKVFAYLESKQRSKI